MTRVPWRRSESGIVGGGTIVTNGVTLGDPTTNDIVHELLMEFLQHFLHLQPAIFA